MAKFNVTVVETVRITFTLEADDPFEAEAEAEIAAVERRFPPNHKEHVEREIDVKQRP